MKASEIGRLCKTAAMGWVDDYAPSMGAAISYYTVFSLAPLLVLVIAIAGAVFGRDAVQGLVAAQLSGLIGAEGALLIQQLIKSASNPTGGAVAGAISIVLLLVGATTVFAELQSALDRIWHVPDKDKPTGVWAVLRARLLSFGLIMGLAFLLMVSLVVSTGVAALGSWMGTLMAGQEVVLQLLNIAVSLAITTVLFAMIFKLMPTAPIAWRDVWVGAGVTSLLFEVGKLLIGLYLGKSGFTETFAAAGSLVVLLAWVYYAAQIFLLGAEFTRAYASLHGSLAQQPVAAAEVQGALPTEGSAQTPSKKAGGVAATENVADDAALESVSHARERTERHLERAKVALARELSMVFALELARAVTARWAARRRKDYRAIRKLAHARRR